MGNSSQYPVGPAIVDSLGDSGCKSQLTTSIRSGPRHVPKFGHFSLCNVCVTLNEVVPCLFRSLSGARHDSQHSSLGCLELTFHFGGQGPARATIKSNRRNNCFEQSGFQGKAVSTGLENFAIFTKGCPCRSETIV